MSCIEVWRSHVIAEARAWLRTPYQHKGGIKGVGVDCGRLLWAVYNPIVGPLRPFPTDYAPDWAMHRGGDDRYTSFVEQYAVRVSRPLPGGVAVFKVGHNWSHGAVITDRGTYIHSWGRNQHGAVVEWERARFVYGLGQGSKQREVLFYDLKAEMIHGPAT